jgi:hypothetical protein
VVDQTKVCPDCAETVKAPARVCRFCGYRFDAATATSGQPTTENLFATPVDKRGWFLVWGVASALLMALGSFGPWVGTFGGGIAGIHGRHGWFVVAAAAVGTVLFVLWRQRRAAGMWALLAGLVGLAVTVHERRRLTLFLHPRNPVFGPLVRGFVHVGWGLDLAMFASISFALCGLSWLLVLTDAPETARIATPPTG